MPTPFYHLSIAEELIDNPGLHPDLRTRLFSNRYAFLLGNTAPDVQVISGKPRQATHFFTLPVDKTAGPPWQVMQETYPALSVGDHLPAAQSAFIAGYLCHLQADWLWVLQVFLPVFGPHSKWRTFHERLYLHNALRAYLDREVLQMLPAGTGQGLEQVEPEVWLPFVADRHLREWRSYLSGQLMPGARVETVEVFAGRQGMSPQKFYRLIESEDRMNEQVFSHIARDRLAAFRKELIGANIRLLDTFFQPVGAG